MKQVRNDSVIAVWNRNYLNSPENRDEEDRNVIILQVEHSTGNDYIVEFYRR